VANADSGIEELASRLAEALGAAQFPPSGPMASLAELVGQQESGDRSQETEGTASAAHVGQLVAGNTGEGTASMSDAAAALTAAVEQQRSITQAQAGTTDQNASASKSSSLSSSGGSSALDTIGNVAASVFEDGLGLGPLIGGLAGLLGGGGGSSAPPGLSAYMAPESIQFEGDVNRSANTTDWGGSGGTQSGSPLSTGAQITVQVNAMDSQSFLDHSQDIANAVRQAMLNSNSLNDVVSDL